MGNSSKKCTEEQKKYYMTMFKEISAHKDFGKRNPVDIGIERGYTEAEVLGMIQMLKESQNEEGGKETEGVYYFFVRKERDKYIISVNCHTWEIGLIKKIDNFDENFGQYDLKGNIFVRTYGNGRDGQKTLLWEDLKSGEKRKLLTDESIERLVILDSGILIVTDNDLQIWDGKKILSRKENEKYFRSSINIIETEKDLYFYSTRSEMYSIDKELKGEYKTHEIEYPSTSGTVTQYPHIRELGVDEGKIFGYGYYERYGHGFFNTNKVWIDFPLKLNTGVEKVFHFDRDIKKHCYKVVKNFTTKEYGLLGTEIYSREQMESEDKRYPNPVCYFKRNLESKQVIANYDEDIFIGLTKDDDIIKIDLKNEREAVVLPVDLKTLQPNKSICSLPDDKKDSLWHSRFIESLNE